MADRVAVRHVEGEVGAHHHPVRAPGPDEIFELVRGEDDGVEEDLPQVMRRRIGQAAAGVAAGAPGMVDPPGIGRQIPAAMHRQDLQRRVAFQHPGEDQVMQREGGIEGVADDVVEIERRQPLRLGEARGVDHHQRAEPFGRRPDLFEGRVGQLLPLHIGQHLHALEAERTHAARQLRHRRIRVLHGDAAHAEEAVRPDGAEGGDPVIHHRRRPGADLGRQGVVGLRRRRRADLEVHPHGVDRVDPRGVVGEDLAAVLHLLAVDGVALSRGMVRAGRQGGEVRRGEGGGFRHQHMRMDVDGPAGRAQLPPRLPMGAGGGGAVMGAGHGLLRCSGGA